MAKKSFDLGDSLAAALGRVSDSDRLEQIAYIDFTKLDEDVDNFYSMEGIDELAANIELIGLQQPLRVRPNPEAPDRYLIVSGHRRRKAIGELYNENPEKWAKVACIVEQTAGSPELQELRLIFANANTRTMTSADLAKQAARVEELLYKLKAQGISFSGRMRDQVAAAVKVGATKLAELKVIQKRLIPELRQLWEKGEINHAVAYRFAQAEEREQLRITELCNEQEIKFAPEWRVDNWLQMLRGVAAISCPDDGAACSHAAEREMRAIQNLDPCHNRCCIDCWNNVRCKDVCEKAKSVAAEKTAEAEKRAAESAALREQAKRERLEHQKKECEDARAAWERTLYAADKADVDLRTLVAHLQEVDETDIDDEEIEEMVGWANGTLDTYDSPWWDEVDCLTATADLLHCSTDYLLGRTEDLAPAAPARQADAQTPQFRSGTPAEKTLAWCAFRIGDVDMTTSAVWWPHLGRWCFEHGASIDAECVGWYPLPDWKGVLKDD